MTDSDTLAMASFLIGWNRASPKLRTQILAILDGATSETGLKELNVRMEELILAAPRPPNRRVIADA